MRVDFGKKTPKKMHWHQKATGGAFEIWMVFWHRFWVHYFSNQMTLFQTTTFPTWTVYFHHFCTLLPRTIRSCNCMWFLPYLFNLKWDLYGTSTNKLQIQHKTSNRIEDKWVGKTENTKQKFFQVRRRRKLHHKSIHDYYLPHRASTRTLWTPNRLKVFNITAYYNGL